MQSQLLPLLKENVHHGEVTFPIGHYLCRIPQSFRDLPAHWHEEMEVTLVTEGVVGYQVDDLPLSLQTGDLLIIAPNCLHSAHMEHNSAATTESLVFHLNLLGMQQTDACTIRYLRPLEHCQPICLRLGETGYEEIRSCFDRLWTLCNQHPPYYELRIKEQLFHLIYQMELLPAQEHLHQPSREQLVYDEKLKTVLSYIQSHYAEPITIQELADLVCFSPVYFMKLFKRSVGSSCINYLNEYRIAMAQVELQNTDHSVMQVAMECGFQNISYFNRQFQRRLQMTPTEFRQQATIQRSKC